MRILSLGFPLPGASIDNYNLLSAPAVFDYDAVVIDPRAMSQLIDDVVARDVEHSTFAGERVVNEALEADSVKLAEILHNRIDETNRLLARGGLIVWLATPNAAQPGIFDHPDFQRYSLLAPLLEAGPSFIRRASGTQFGEFETANPFGKMLSQVKNRLSYQVYFEDAALDRDTVAIARSVGGAVVAFATAVGNGFLVLIPPPARPLDSQGRYQFSEALQQAVRQQLHLSSITSAPGWAVDYDVPGLDERVAHRSAIASKLMAEKAALTAADGAVEDLQRYQRLLWGQGRSLDDAVRYSIQLLGLHITHDDGPAMVELKGPSSARRVALLETDGSESVVGLDVHFRMRQRLEEALAAGTPRRGLVIVNGYGRSPPAARPQQYTNELRLASEQMRYCLATSDQLFAAVQASLRGESHTVERFREQLLTSEGVLNLD